MLNDYTIRLEKETDYRAVEELTRETFWNLYKPGCAEHYVLHTYRSKPEFVRELDFVMEKDGRLIGHVMFVRAEINSDEGRKIPIMTFGPISILPEFQRRGYGRALLDYALSKAAEMGVGAVCMEGNINFYRNCGFTVASTLGIHYYAEPRDAEVPYFLARELKKGFLDGVTGVYHTPEGYFVDDKDVEDFDKSFPPKKKLKLTGQLFKTEK